MEQWATNITKWVGSTASVLLHTLLFIVAFTLPYVYPTVTFERMLLVLTTIVSLEAIYLSIFIQMSINLNNQNIESIQEDSEDIEELGEDIEEIGEDIEEMSVDIEEISDDIEELGEDIEEISVDIEEIGVDIEEIQKDVDEIQEDVVEIQEETNEEQDNDKKESEILLSIQATLMHLQKEIEQLKHSR